MKSETPSARVTPDAIAPVQVEMNLPTTKPKPDGEPDWVTNETRTYYKRLVNDSELLGKVADAIETYPNGGDLAREIVTIGFCKADGTALGVDKMSRIRKVVKHLNTPE